MSRRHHNTDGRRGTQRGKRKREVAHIAKRLGINTHDANMAVDIEGTPLPYTPTAVRDIVLKMIAEGEIIAVVVRRDDDLGVQVFGPPSQELLAVLEQATNAYRNVLKGQG